MALDTHRSMELYGRRQAALDTHRSMELFLQPERQMTTDARRDGSDDRGMTQARALLVPARQAGHYRCVTRCVRRAWLCGHDPLTGLDHSARKEMIEARILALGKIFSIGVYSYAVMSNHLHVVLSLLPDYANQWSPEEVVERWLRLFPSRKKQRVQERRAAMLVDADRIAECREWRLNLSWFMRCLNEHLAKV